MCGTPVAHTMQGFQGTKTKRICHVAKLSTYRTGLRQPPLQIVYMAHALRCKGTPHSIGQLAFVCETEVVECKLEAVKLRVSVP